MPGFSPWLWVCLGLAACSSPPSNESDPPEESVAGEDGGTADSAPSDLIRGDRAVGGGVDVARLSDGGVIISAPSLLGSSLGVGYYHICVLDSAQKVICSGSGARATPPATLRGVQIAGAHLHNCVITAAGSPQRLVCFGSANPVGTQLSSPKDLDPIQIAVGDNHNCAIDRDRTVRCWGAAIAMSAPPAGLKAKYIAASGAFSCAIRLEDDEVVCWGARPAMPPPGLKAVHIAVAQNAGPAPKDAGLPTTVRHACAVRSDGSVVCWSDDTSTTVRETVVPAGLVAKEVAVGSHHSCALRIDGTVTCWGAYPRSIPMPPGLKGRAIRAGNGTNCVLRDTDDTVVCWGGNNQEMITGVNGKQVYVPQ